MTLHDRHFEATMMIWKNLKLEAHRKEPMEINTKASGSPYERRHSFGIFCKECTVESSLERTKTTWKVAKNVLDTSQSCKQELQRLLNVWNVLICPLRRRAKKWDILKSRNMVVTAVFLGVIVAGLSILDIYLLKQCFGQPQEDEEDERPAYPVTIPYYVFARWF